MDPDRADPGKLIRVPGGYRVLFSSYFFPTFPILLHFYVTIFFQILKKKGPISFEFTYNATSAQPYLWVLGLGGGHPVCIFKS